MSSQKPLLTQSIAALAIIATTLAVQYALDYFGVLPSPKPDAQELIADYYATENAVTVSPHGLRKDIAKGTSKYLLVDLRSAEEYEKSHIVGAVNVPAYKNPDESAYGEVDRIVAGFRALPKDKELVVYCYSKPCMTGRKIGKILAGHGIYVKHLGIGWNEWRYDWNGWNHEHEWATSKAEDYVVSGKEPGTYSGSSDLFSPCAADGSTGC